MLPACHRLCLPASLREALQAGEALRAGPPAYAFCSLIKLKFRYLSQATLLSVRSKTAIGGQA